MDLAALQQLASTVWSGRFKVAGDADASSTEARAHLVFISEVLLKIQLLPFGHLGEVLCMGGGIDSQVAGRNAQERPWSLGRLGISSIRLIDAGRSQDSGANRFIHVGLGERKAATERQGLALAQIEQRPGLRVVVVVGLKVDPG